MIKVALSPDAVLDYDESFSWYAKRSRKSALELEDEVAAAIDRIASDYEACPHFDDVYQYTRLKRYPFFVVFRVEGGYGTHCCGRAHQSKPRVLEIQRATVGER